MIYTASDVSVKIRPNFHETEGFWNWKEFQLNP